MTTSSRLRFAVGARCGLIAVLLVALLTACGGGGSGDSAPGSATGSSGVSSATSATGAAGGVNGAAPLRVTEVKTGLVNPWSLAFLPDGRTLITQRGGSLMLLSADGKTSSPVTGVPAVETAGQGGLLDVALDPAFATNRRIYLSFVERDTTNAALNGTAVARAELDTAALTLTLTNVTVIFRQTPKVQSVGHFGSRLVFDTAGYLWVTTGDRLLDSERGYAQDLTRGNSKVMRITTSGGAAPGNPTFMTMGRKVASGATATAMCRAPRAIRLPANSGPTSMARKAATRSTARWPAATTAGRWSPTGRNTAPPRLSACSAWQASSKR